MTIEDINRAFDCLTGSNCASCEVCRLGERHRQVMAEARRLLIQKVQAEGESTSLFDRDFPADIELNPAPSWTEASLALPARKPRRRKES
jgi:RecB family endonuclease NucS